jgi:rubrerythrin
MTSKQLPLSPRGESREAFSLLAADRAAAAAAFAAEGRLEPESRGAAVAAYEGPYLCLGCGYGICVKRADLPRCPMCGTRSWRPGTNRE